MSREEHSPVFGVMQGTFLLRCPALAIVGRPRSPERVLRRLRYVPVAVLAITFAPKLLIRDSVPALSNAIAHLVACGRAITWPESSPAWAA